MTANSRKRVPTRSPPTAARAGTRAPGNGGRAGSRVPCLVAALIIRKAALHRLSGRETLGTSFVEVVAVLGTGVSVILPDDRHRSRNRRRAKFSGVKAAIALCGDSRLLAKRSRACCCTRVSIPRVPPGGHLNRFRNFSDAIIANAYQVTSQ